jgi:hypothetical protein
MTTDLKGHELFVIVAMLDTLSIGGMKAAWKKMTAAELAARSRKSSPRSDRDSADCVPGTDFAPLARRD